MISYSNMDNMFTYDTNMFYNARCNAVNNYNGMPNYGYCPYAAYNNTVQNFTRSNCPYSNNSYYQYSPTVNCINPSYQGERNFGGFENPSYNGELRMRTVSIEDIRD